VLARVVGGAEFPPPAVPATEKVLATDLLPHGEAVAATWSVALMELGALVCTARAPRCDDCPLRDRCAWQRAGAPAYEGPARRVQRFVGTDRQVRGLLMAVLRDRPGPAGAEELAAVWSDSEQRDRALAGLVTDGLVVADGGSYRLP
jgi:A/G-specific adenine glycosylase